jgi:hypothetical protein
MNRRLYLEIGIMCRLLPTLFLSCFSLFVAPIAFAQVTDGTNIGNLDQDRARTKEIRDARQAIDDYPAENYVALPLLFNRS